jgi:hypothetical protein
MSQQRCRSSGSAPAALNLRKVPPTAVEQGMQMHVDAQLRTLMSPKWFQAGTWCGSGRLPHGCGWASVPCLDFVWHQCEKMTRDELSS